MKMRDCGICQEGTVVVGCPEHAPIPVYNRVLRPPPPPIDPPFDGPTTEQSYGASFWINLTVSCLGFGMGLAALAMELAR